MKIFLFGLGFVAPLLALAQVQQATIITRPGVATAPLKYYFDLSSALAEGINQSVKITVSASNAEKTAVRFDSVQLFDKSGVLVGRNVASKTDALTSTPYAFVFQNFGVPASELASVAGVQITFMDLGGENSTGKVTVQSVAVSVNRESGDQCIIVDPFIEKIPPPPIPTIISIQRQRPLVQPGTHGDGGSSGGGGGGSTDTGFRNPGAATGGFLSGDVAWASVSNVLTSNNAYATASLTPGQSTQGLYASNFGFSVPDGATINGITATIERVGQTNITDGTVMLTIDGGTTTGSNMASGAWTMAEEVASYGGVSNTWGIGSLTLTPTVVNSSAFGLVLSAMVSIGGGATPSVDNIQIKITYTAGGGSVYDSFMDLIRMVADKISCRIAPSSSCEK